MVEKLWIVCQLTLQENYVWSVGTSNMKMAHFQFGKFFKKFHEGSKNQHYSTDL